MKKKIRVLCLMCLLVIGFLIPMKSEAASSKLRIIGQGYPTSLKMGSQYSLKGRIKSNYKIKRVCAGVYSSNGRSAFFKKTTYPRTRSYNLAGSQQDWAMQFDRLKEGTYLYKVAAKDASGKTKTLVKKRFKVVSSQSTLRIVSQMPKADFSIDKGGCYTVSGTVKSNYRITQVYARVETSGGTVKFSQTVSPNTKKFVVGQVIDNAMAFDTLTSGVYRYILTAKDKSGTSKTLVMQSFTVKETDDGNGDGSNGNGDNGNGSGGNGSSGNVPVGYVKRTAPPAGNNLSYYSGLHNIYFNYDKFAPTGKRVNGGYVNGNCTWYAAGRAREVLLQAGKSPNLTIFGNDPVDIWKANKAQNAYPYGNTPKIGSLIVYNYGSDGNAHIAMVEDIVNGIPYVSESGFVQINTPPAPAGISFHYGSAYNWGMGRQILGYIYLI